MGIWSAYNNRISALGGTIRNASLIRESRYINSKLPNNLSYTTAIVEGEEQNVAIINSDNFNEKKIISMPGESITQGSLVHWMDQYWLVTEKDYNETIYTRAKMLQCNYLLKWVSDDNVIHEQWCVVEDGTKYLTGEYEDRNFVITRGDTRLSVTIAINDDTAKLDREDRFLIDDSRSGVMLAYQLSKPYKLGNSFNGEGVYKFVLQEVTTTDYDNQELGIADYYKHFPRITEKENTSKDVIDTTEVDPRTGKAVWL